MVCQYQGNNRPDNRMQSLEPSHRILPAADESLEDTYAPIRRVAEYYGVTDENYITLEKEPPWQLSTKAAKI